MLLGVYLGCLPVFGFQTAGSPGFVYCPLQEKWVARGGFSTPPKKVEPLADVCAPQKIKAAFLAESVNDFRFLRISFDSEQTTNLFFSYAEEGNRAFAEIERSPDLPERRLLQAAAAQKSLVNRQKDFDKKAVEKFVLKQLARPPTTGSKTFYQTQSVRALGSVSRRIQPRAPPAFRS